jgi:hypothetical protein
MLHPILPSARPPIHEPVQKANSISTTDNSHNSQSAVQITLDNSQEISNGNELAVLKTTSKPSTPESFPAEFSPITAAKSAEVLGQQLTVGYPLQESDSTAHEVNNKQLTSQTSPQTEQISPVVAKSKNLSQLLVKKLIQARQQKGTSTVKLANQPIQQPIQIEFNAQESANQPSKPSTLDFEPRRSTTQLPTPNSNTQQQSAPTSQPNTTTGQQSQPAGQNTPANTPQQTRRVIEVVADRQEYDQQRRVVTAEGHVIVRMDGSILDADRLQVNLDNLIAVGEGNVALTRGDQVLRGQRFTYNFIQDSGQLIEGRGEIYIPTAQKDLAFLPTDVTTGGVPQTPLSDRIRSSQPLQVTNRGGINFTVGGARNASNLPGQKQGGTVKRLRFEAAKIDFYPRGWQARDARITNDPFSPPELVLRADKVTLTRESPLQDKIKTQHQRLVFDQGVSVPIPKDEQTIDRSERNVTPAIAAVAYDGTDRGGFYVERGFKFINQPGASFSITPQILLQKAVQNLGNVSDLFGVKTKLNFVLSPQTIIQGTGQLTSLDFSKVEDNLRASLRLRQSVGDPRNPYRLTVEYSYRDRLYNGSLGFQTVQSSAGGVITSPIIPLGKSGLNLSYQAGAQYINANTDRQDLLKPIRDNNRISLGRLQGSIALSRGIPLWRGKPLPPTPTGGLRYTPTPLTPFLNAYAGVTGTSSYYTSGDNQSTLTGTVGLTGQFGHFSRPYLDYTAFVFSYSQGLNSGLSPFLFDRAVDTKVLTVGITQQIYGPFRFGFQTSVNLDTGRSTSTDYVLEYSRRTYGITLRYNPDLQLGGISFRISDFNWTGGTDPFSDTSEVKSVVNGVRRDY